MVNYIGLISLISVFFFNQAFASPLLLSNSSTFTEETLYFVANCQKKAEHPKSILIQSSRTEPSKQVASNPIAERNIVQTEPKSEVIDWIYQERKKIADHLKSIEGYLQYKEKYHALAPMLFCLNTVKNTLGVDELNTLTRIKPETGIIEDHFLIDSGFTKGHLLFAEVHFQRAWHDIVLLSLSANPAKNDAILIFDVTENKDLKPLFTLKLNEDFKLISKPLCFRLVDKSWAVALGGILKGKGTIIIFSLEDFSEKFILAGDGHSIINFVAVDSETRGVVDKIYAQDDKGKIWKFEVNKLTISNTHSKQVLDGKMLGTIRGSVSGQGGSDLGASVLSRFVPSELKVLKVLKVLRNPYTPGLLILSSALDPQQAISHQSKIHVINDSIINDRSSALIVPSVLDLSEKWGSLQGAANVSNSENVSIKIKAIFFRFGRMIVVTDNPLILPKVFQISKTGWKEIPKEWRIMNNKEFTDKGLTESSKRLEGLVLLWDPKKKVDVLVTLNDSCQLSFLVADIHSDKNGRISFRSVQEQENEEINK